MMKVYPVSLDFMKVEASLAQARQKGSIGERNTFFASPERERLERDTLQLSAAISGRSRSRSVANLIPLVSISNQQGAFIYRHLGFG